MTIKPDKYRHFPLQSQDKQPKTELLLRSSRLMLHWWVSCYRKFWKSPIKRKNRLECVIVRWRTQHDPKKAAWSLNTVIVSCVSDMKSIWKSSDLFLLHSVEELSKARRRGEKNMAGYRLELLFSPEGHIKRSFDPKLKLNKGPNTQWLKK